MEFISNIQAFGGWRKKTQGVGDGGQLTAILWENSTEHYSN